MVSLRPCQFCLLLLVFVIGHPVFEYSGCHIVQNLSVVDSIILETRSKYRLPSTGLLNDACFIATHHHPNWNRNNVRVS